MFFHSWIIQTHIHSQAIVFHEELSALPGADSDTGFRQCVTLNSFHSATAENAYVTFGLLAMYGLPLAAVVLVNSLLVCRLRGGGNAPVTLHADPTRDNTRLNQFNGEPQCTTTGGDISTPRGSSPEFTEDCGGEESEVQVSTDLPSQVRVRCHTGLQLRHRELAIQLRARRRALILSALMVVTFVVSCTPYVYVSIEKTYHSTVLSRGVRWLFGPTRKSSPWGNVSDGGLNQSIKRRLSL